MARADPQLNLRLPAALKAQLEQAAKASNRTLTAETVARLESSFSKMSVDDPLALVIRLERQIAETEKESCHYQIQALLLSREIKRFTSALTSHAILSDSNLKTDSETLLQVANFIEHEIEVDLKKRPKILEEITSIGRKAINWLLKPY